MDVARVGTGYEEATGRSTALERARRQRASLRRALSAVEDALAAPAAGRAAEWNHRLVAALEHLAEVFELHVAVTEPPGGLYEEVLEIAPRLANLVERFRREHREIARSIEQGLARARTLNAEDAEEVERLRERLTLLLGRLVRHRQRGADLLYEAYAVDIGGES